MSTQRTRTILALEALRADSAFLVERGLALNALIMANKIPVPLFDVMPAWNSQVFAERALANMELQARGVSSLVRSA